MSRSSNGNGVLRGAIVCESLKPGTVLEGYRLQVTKWRRYEVAEPAEWQPSIWTLIEFEASADDSDALAQRLSKDLGSPGWYANWNSETETVVVFADRVFRYKRGDRSARIAVQKYGRAAGVPEPHLDWPD